MTVQADVEFVLAYFDHNQLRPNSSARGWQHMGATLTDAALQRRTRYKRVVLPRVLRLMQAWPDAVTVSAFTARLNSGDIREVIRWSRPAKLQVIADLTAAMTALRINTCADLKHLAHDLRGCR